MPSLEVRCCCDAGRLLGHLEVEPDLIRCNQILTFTLRAPPLLGHWDTIDDGPPQKVTIERVQLEINFLNNAMSLDAPYLAVKSNDYPIETLRRVPGFTELQR